MQDNSRKVESAQAGIHERLPDVLGRHAAHPYRKPYAAFNVDAWQGVRAAWGGASPLILDTGCGVGVSTLRLAREHPDHFVVGVDQSADRLGRGKAGPVPDNALFVRADLVDLWRLMADDGVRLAQHWMLYPNPWPKPQHLQRRWHGHSVFPLLLRLGGVLELRTNWQVYADEHAYALQALTGAAVRAEPWQTSDPLTAFERKYLGSGHRLWRVRHDLGRPA